jgi:hypothetical protein
MPIAVMVATTVQRSKIEVRDIFIGTNMTAPCRVINALIDDYRPILHMKPALLPVFEVVRQIALSRKLVAGRT